MAVKIGFITGARCEYGIAKKLLDDMDSDENFELSIFPTGMHLLKRFGYTVSEIIADGFSIDTLIETYKEDGDDKAYEFTNSVDKIYRALKVKNLDCVYVIGDRIEVYAAALAAHFLKIPIIHLGGGAITWGAVDNIYRYNITYLSTIHLASSRNHYNRLLKLEALRKDHIHLVGSTTVDGIMGFKKAPIPITNTFPEIRPQKFVLMTFHPATSADEPLSGIMDCCMERVVRSDFDLLVTYPNNDEGCLAIIDTIERWEGKKNVFISKSLGIEGYYSALYDCAFVIGNSSSGVIEVPYFNKRVLNVGRRQEGRDRDVGVEDISADADTVLKKLDKALSLDNTFVECNNVYGDGNSAKKSKEVILKYFNGEKLC